MFYREPAFTHIVENQHISRTVLDLAVHLSDGSDIGGPIFIVVAR